MQAPAAQSISRESMQPASNISDASGLTRNSQWQQDMTAASEIGRQNVQSDAAYAAPEIATALSDPHLRRLHNAAMAWKARSRQRADTTTAKPP